MKRSALVRWIPFRLAALVAPLIAAWPQNAQAAPLTWDGNGTTVPNPNGGYGTWDVNVSTNWWDGAANVVWPVPGGTDDDAVFGNNAGVVSLAPGGVTANDLTFNTTGYLIQNNILALNGTTPTINTASGVTATINSVVAGTVGLAKAGDGTLTLTGVNTYTGGTTISGGTLELGAGTIQPTIHSTYAIGSGSMLRIRHNTATGATAQTWSKFTGAGTLAFATGKNNDSGAGTAALGNTFTGTLQIEGGRIQLLAATGAATNYGLGAATKVVITNGGHLGMWENLVTLPSTVAFDIAGTGYGEGGYESAIRMGNGSATSTIQGTVNLTNSATIGASGGIGIISGAITGGSSAGLTFGTGSQTGTVALTGANTYSGPTTVNFGTLRIGNGSTTGSLNTASTIHLNGGTLAFNRSDNIIQGTHFSGAPITGSIGAGALNQTGPGILTLTAANTYVGGTTIAGGTIQQGAANVLPVGRALTVNGTGVFDLNGFNSSISTLGGAATGTVTDNAAGAGTTTLSLTAATSSAPIIKNGASRTMALRVTNENLQFLLTNGGNAFSGGIVLTGSASGTRMSPGTITAGAYGSGAITVGEAATDLAGIYLSIATQTLANPIIANTGLGTDRVGTFRVDTIGNTLSGQLTANLAPMTFSTNGTGAVTATNQVTGPNGLTLLSHGLVAAQNLTVTLSNAAGTNDYAGDTVINQNATAARTYTLALGAADQIPNGAGKGNVSVFTNGTGVGRLNLGGFSETINGLSGNGTVDGISGTPVLTLGDNNAHGNFSGSLVNAAGSLALVKTGAGVQTLSGASTYAGGTTVSAGTLVGANSSALGTNGALTVANSANFSYRPTAAGALNLGSGVLSLAGGSRIGGAVGGTLSQSAITSSGAAITAGAVTVDLSGTPGVAVTTGTHDLITAASGLDTAAYTLGNIYNATNFTVNAGTLASSPGAVSIGVTSASALTSEIWKGGLSGAPAVWAISNGATASNWASDAGGTDTPLTPGPAATITFAAAGATNQAAMTLGASMSVAGLVVNDTNPVGLNADGNTLTLGAGGVTINGGAGAVTLGASISLGAAQSWTNNSGSPFTIAGTMANGGFTHSIGGSGAVSLNGSLTGTGGLTKTGAGTMTLTGISNYTGPTTISGGTLKLGGAGVLPTTAAVVLGNAAGATFDINGLNSFVGSLAGGGATGGTVSIGTASLTSGRDNTSTTYSGTITGAGGTFNKVGGGTLTLAGAASNSYTGTTTVYQGDLSLAKTGGATAIGGHLIFDNNASPDVHTLVDNQFVPGTVVSFVTDLGDHGRLELMGTTQTVAGVQTGGYMGAPRGVIQTRESGPAVIGNSTLVLNGSGNYIYNGFLRSSGGVISVTKNGTGTQTLVGAQIIHTGATSLSNGTLTLQDTTAFASPITLSGSGVLNSVRTVTGFANRGKLFGTDATASVSGTGVVNINNTGNGVLGGWTVVGRANGLTMAGTININSGTFARDNTSVNNINTTATVNVAAGAAFGAGRGGNSIIGALNGAGDVGALWSGTSAGSITLGNGGVNGAFSGILHGNGNGTDGTLEGGIFSVIKIGPGTQSLSGANTYIGTTSANGGVLQLDFAAGGTSNILAPASAVVLGGGILEIKGGGGEANTQTVNGVSGIGTLQLTQNGATSINATLGAIGAGSINFAGSDATAGALGNVNFLTSTGTTGDDGTTRLGAHLWNGTGWASTSAAGGNHVVPWAGTYADIYNGSTPGPVAIPTATPTAEVRILEATGGFTNNTLGASETINSLLMSAGTTAATVDMGANTLTAGNGAGATGAIAIGSSAASLIIGASANQGSLTAGSSLASVLALNNQSGTSTLTVNSVIANNAGAGAVSLSTNGSVVLNGTNTFTGATTIAGGTLQIGGAGTLGAGTYAGPITTNGTLKYSSSAAQTISGVISGTGSLVKDTSGSSTLILTGANTYTGGTTISDGTVQLGNGSINGTVTSGLYNVAAGATLYLNNATAVQALTAGWASRVRGAGTLRLNSAQTVTGIANWGPNLISAVPFDPGFTGTLQVDNGRFDSSPAGLGGITNMVFNTNSQFMAWTGTYSQPFSLAGDGFGEAGQPGALRVASGSVSVFNGNITLTANAGFNTQDGNSVMTLNGAISGVGFNVAKHNAGLMVLNGANTYSGTTTINAGTLRLGSGGTTGSLNPASTITITGGTLAFNRSDNVSQGTHFSTAAITGAGAVNQMGPGTVTLNAANSYAGTTTITAGILNANSSAALGNGSATNTLIFAGGTLQAGGTITSPATRGVTLTANGFIDTNGNDVSIAGIISGAGTLTKQGSGTVTFSGNNTYTGPTLVLAGDLRVNGSITTSSLTTVSSGASLSGSGTVGALALNAGSSINPGNSPGILSTGSAVSTANVNIEIGGLTPGNGTGFHDQINTTGSLTLDGGLLTISLVDSYIPTMNDAFDIWLNDGGDSILGAGTFTGLPEGSQIPIPETSGGPGGGLYSDYWTITYAGNTGNDIRLVYVPEPSSTLLGGAAALLALSRRRRKVA